LRVTLDSNVYVSALNFGGVPETVLLLAAEEAFHLQLSPPILEETTRILRAKFHWSLTDLIEARDTLTSISHRVITHIQLDVVRRDPKDNFILECSQASRSDYVVTGDNHLLELKQYAGARIVKPAEFLRLVQT